MTGASVSTSNLNSTTTQIMNLKSCVSQMHLDLVNQTVKLIAEVAKWWKERDLNWCVNPGLSSPLNSTTKRTALALL
jgi:hypothetical protein